MAREKTRIRITVFMRNKGDEKPTVSSFEITTIYSIEELNHFGAARRRIDQMCNHYARLNGYETAGFPQIEEIKE